MASEQGESPSLPGGIEEWLADHTDETGRDRAEVLARAVASYRLLTEETDGDEPLESTLAELEARIESLEADSPSEADTDRIAELETELDEHVQDLRSKIVDVLKEARSRAPADHSHEPLEARLDEQAQTTAELDETTDELEALLTELAEEFDAFDKRMEARFNGIEQELGPMAESVADLESKATKLAGAVVDMRKRLARVESHVSHQTALAELLQTAAREDVTQARCDSCNETVELGLLVEPICPHCRSVFDGIEPGSMFFKSAWLTIADRPALEAGETTKQPFDIGEAQTASRRSNRDTQ